MKTRKPRERARARTALPFVALCGMIALGIERTQRRLTEFEQRFGMSSAEFERRLNTLELAETVEFTDWRMEIGMLCLLESQYQTLQEAQLD